MLVAVIASAVLVAVAAMLALVRVERGPSMLDRAVALDALTMTLVAAIAVEAIWTRRTETIPILVALSMVGFVSSVTLSRFAAREPTDKSQGTSPEDVAAQARESVALRAETPRSAHDDDLAPAEDDGTDGEVRA